MRRAPHPWCLIAVTSRATCCGQAHRVASEHFTIEPSHSQVVFSIRHVATRVYGQLDLLGGSVRYDPEHPELTAVDATLRSESVRTGNDIRDTRLRGAEFLDAEAFPSVTFTSTSAERCGGRLELHGRLNIRGVTRRVLLVIDQVATAQGDAPGNRLVATAHATLSRTDFGIGTSSALEAGGVLIGNAIPVRIEVELVRQ